MVSGTAAVLPSPPPELSVVAEDASPAACSHVRVVADARELLTAAFNDQTNCFVLPSGTDLSGDFNTLAVVMAEFFGVDRRLVFTAAPERCNRHEKPFSELDRFTASSDDLRRAFALVAVDIRQLQEEGHAPTLRLMVDDPGDGCYEPYASWGTEWGRFLRDYTGPGLSWFTQEGIERICATDLAQLRPDAQLQRFPPGATVRFRCLQEGLAVPNPFVRGAELQDGQRIGQLPPRLILSAG